MPFTDRQISSLKPKKQRYEVKESGRTGLGIRVTPRGVKTWTFIYRFDGKQKRMVFGTYPQVSLSEAHKALADAKHKLLANIDPGAEIAEARAAEQNAETVADMVTEYIERHAKPTMKERTAVEDERILRREVIPFIGVYKAKDVTRRDLIVLLDRIADRGATVLRNRTAGVLSRFFLFGLDRGIVQASPAAGIRRLEEKARERFLSMEEIGALWRGLDEIDAIPQVRIGIKLLLTTGQRRFEVAGIERAEIDDAAGLWRLPGERSKNGNPNMVPLPPFIMALIDEADGYRVRPAPTRPNRTDRPEYDPSPSPFLLPARIVGKPLEPAALTRALNRNRDKLGVGDATIHDLRRTFATAHGSIGTPKEIRSALLNHAPEGITAKVYDQSERIEPAWLVTAKREAMTRYCEWLKLVIAGDFEAARKMEGAEVKQLTNVA